MLQIIHRTVQQPLSIPASIPLHCCLHPCSEPLNRALAAIYRHFDQIFKIQLHYFLNNFDIYVTKTDSSFIFIYNFDNENIKVSIFSQ